MTDFKVGERVVYLGPEALQGLSPDDRSYFFNRHIPAGATGTVEKIVVTTDAYRIGVGFDCVHEGCHTLGGRLKTKRGWFMPPGVLKPSRPYEVLYD